MVLFKQKDVHPSFIIIGVLSVVLLIAAFALGSLYTKVKYLEKGQAAVPTQQAQAAVQGTQPQLTEGQRVKMDIGHLPPNGDPKAKVQIVEFADFRCPFCKQAFTDTISQIENEYVKTGKAVLYFRHYAFLGPSSTVASNATECANAQGKFWDMYTYLYQNQPAESDTSMYTTDKLTSVATTLGMDGNTFSSCLSANTYNQKVTDDMTAGQAVGVTGTPTFFINGMPIVGAQPYASFKTIIDAELAK